MVDGIGLSVGATTLRGVVVVGRSAVTRSPVLTRYPHRPAEVGVPGENPNLTERGLVVTNFVDRVGDPVAIVADDGSSHQAETLLAEALRAVLLVVTSGRPPAGAVGVTHPAHWPPSAVDALRGALGLPLTSDAVTALTALADDPGVPTRGIVALCDLGGSGTSITLADAGNGFAPIGPTVRHADLSGDVIDQALLRRVIDDLATAGTVDPNSTSAIGSLSRLRGQCRAAKERLSTSAVTSLAVELPALRTEVRITRNELDEAIREPIAGLVAVLQDTLQRNGIRPADLVAVASVGGGAHIPILTTTLSEHLRVPVIKSGQPELAAAIGGALLAVRGASPDGTTSLSAAPAAVAAPVPDPPAASSTFRALAWSDADDPPEPTPHDPRPQLAFAERDDDDVRAAPLPWYRRPGAIIAAGLVVVAAVVIAAVLYLLGTDESPTTDTTPTPGTTTAAPSTEATPPPADAPPPTQATDPPTVPQQAPPPVVTPTQQPPAAPTPPPPAPTTEAPAPPPPTTEAPPPPPTTQPPLIPTLPYETIPGLPFVPAPIQPPPP